MRPGLKLGPLSEDEMDKLRTLYYKHERDIAAVENLFANRGPRIIKNFFRRKEFDEKKKPNHAVSGRHLPVSAAAAAVAAARAQYQPRQLTPLLSCPLCDKVVISARGGAAQHKYNCIFPGFVSLFDLKKRGNVGVVRSQCAWMRLQDEGWMRGISAALRRSNNNKSVLVLTPDAVVEKEDGELKRSFALPREIKLGEINDLLNRAGSKIDDQAIDIGN